MDKAYDHKKYEEDIYRKWEEAGAFSPTKNPEAKPFCIIMPPPNSNGELHLGHATFVAISDALIRYHRMKGGAALWLPGVDHAGIATQASFEKKLQKEQDKSRFDLGREEFVRQCYEFCMNNKHIMEEQMKDLGSSCDWTREKFTLDPNISKLVYQTFEKMNQEGLIYRGYRIVNWCTRCRSTLSDLETEEKEQTDKLYYLDYGLVTVATTRPETIFADVAIAVNPKDKKMAKFIGKKAVIPIINKEIEITGDEAVETDFGTGALKVTPGHDMTDFEIGERHHLPIISVINFDGRMTGEIPEELKNLKVKEAREKTVEMLKSLGKLIKTEDLPHTVKICERCGTIIEPLISRQWFVKIKALAEPAIKAVEVGRVKIIPEKYEKMYFNWMRNIRDWPISRQLWWGHQLPVWYRREDQKTEEQRKEFELLKQGDTRARTDVLESPTVAIEKPQIEGDWIQDPDTFDTWFSSGQWPINTLKTSGPKDWEKFYPTAVMNTAYEILFLWVARMIMFGLYLTGEVPFQTVLINGVLRDEKGVKMSKSKGNGVNPNEAIDKYGADAVRFALIAGRDNGNDLLMSKQQMEERIRGYRNFANKLWNIARFVESAQVESDKKYDKEEWIIKEMNELVKKVDESIENFRLGQVTEEIYEFVWHRFADVYIEEIKDKKTEHFPTLRHVLITSLKLLHPFMPFVTEAIWGEIREMRSKPEEMLINSEWPDSAKASTGKGGEAGCRE